MAQQNDKRIAHAFRTRWPGRTKFALAVVVWTLLVLASLLTQRDRIEDTARSLAKTDAVTSLDKDMAIRQWASNVNGVYIRDEFIPAFNFLEEEQRVTVQPVYGEAFQLVRVTPMHLLLAIQQTSNQKFGRRERLTSGQLRNIENEPDAWEARALEALKDGQSVVAEEVSGRGHGLMRVMLPMRMDEECLECHRDTLVPVGALRGGASIQVDLNNYRAAQEPIWRMTQYWHAGIWLLGLGGILTFQFFARRRALELIREEEARRENEAAFSPMAEGAMITNATGDILWANDAFCRISGFGREEIGQQNFRFFMNGTEGNALHRDIQRQLARNGHWRGELSSRKKTGEPLPCEMSIQALRGPDGKIRRAISVFSDISERKKIEQELRRHREHLEELVKQRTEELTVARNQAEAANRSKSTFLANMNHELRTPLNAVIGFAQLMEKDAALSAKQQYNAEIISASARHLLTLINDILELTKIESGKTPLQREDTDLTELLTQTAAMLRPRAEQVGIVLNIETVAVPRVLRLDPVILRQVLLNLMSNALKFTPGGRVDVRIEGSPETARAEGEADKARLSFSVLDTGVGIAPEHQERIFLPFEQVGSAHPEGTGLGLAISRQYVEMMGGELRVESGLGRGACFYFTITTEIGREACPLPSDAPVIGLAVEDQGRRVLVVDQQASARRLVRALLEPLGFCVDEVDSLAAAERRLLLAPPDLVLTDWTLPDGNGVDFLRRARARDNPPRLIMLTAHALEENRRLALAAGADDFLGKPFEKDDLFRMLERRLSIRFLRATPSSASPAATATVTAKTDAQFDHLAEELKCLSPHVYAALTQAALTLSPAQIDLALRNIAAENAELATRIGELCGERQYWRLWRILGISDKEQAP
ncbi:MAG: response regulator [Zoogloeaceae bacterium]|nr:response regulator [Zoogloeaceae bacterium]